MKKKKSVSWAPDGRLEQIKLIERAVYDDDPVDVSIFLFASSLGSWCEISVYLLGAFVVLQGTTIHNIRDLDRDEGAAMHAQLFEELTDWIEPQGEITSNHVPLSRIDTEALQPLISPWI